MTLNDLAKEFSKLIDTEGPVPAIRWSPDGTGPSPPTMLLQRIPAQSPISSVRGPWMPAGDLYAIGGTVNGITRFNELGGRVVSILKKSKRSAEFSAKWPSHVPRGCGGVRWLGLLFEMASEGSLDSLASPRLCIDTSGRIAVPQAELDAEFSSDEVDFGVVKFDRNSWYQEFQCGAMASMIALEAIGSSIGQPVKRIRTPDEDQRDWDRVCRDYSTFRKPKDFRPERGSRYRPKFQAFYASRRDLQSIAIDRAWTKLEAARKRRSRKSV